MGLGIMICFRLKVETLIIPFRLIPLFLCFNLVQSPIFKEGEFNASPFLRGIEGDLLELLIAESNS
jgi:hypothetical protein